MVISLYVIKRPCQPNVMSSTILRTDGKKRFPKAHLSKKNFKKRQEQSLFSKQQVIFHARIYTKLTGGGPLTSLLLPESKFWEVQLRAYASF